MTKSMSHIKVTEPTAEGQRCPFLGLHDDPGTALAYPSSWNYCYHATPPASVQAAHQEEACLCPLYVNCVVYLTGKTDPLPASLHGKRRAHLKRHDSPRRPGRFFLFLLLGLAFLLAPFLLFGFPSVSAARLLSLAGLVRSTAVSVSPAPPAHTQVPRPESLAGKPGRSTPTEPAPAPRPSLTPSPLAPSLSCGHALDEPFGEDPGFVLHRVASGENLSLYAKKYETSAEAILVVNHRLPTPVWPDWIVVIPVGVEQVPDRVPAFETYQALEAELSLSELARQLDTNALALARYNDFDAACRSFSGWLLVPRERAE